MNLTKREIVEAIDSLNWNIGDYFIVEETALVIYGIREYCSNISLAVSEIFFETLKEEGKLKIGYPDEEGYYTYNDEIEVRIDSKMEYRLKDKYPVESIKSIAEFKKKRGFPKDLLDIEKMERYLKKKL